MLHPTITQAGDVNIVVKLSLYLKSLSERQIPLFVLQIATVPICTGTNAAIPYYLRDYNPLTFTQSKAWTVDLFCKQIVVCTS